MATASDIREKLTPILIESITNTEDGAGSDLGFAEWQGDEWIEIGPGRDAALDIHHLVGDVIEFLKVEGLIEK